MPYNLDMNVSKLIQTVAYVLYRNDGEMDYYNLIKECYIADRMSIEKTGRSITGDCYVSMNRGPVLKNLYTFIKNKHGDKDAQKVWNGVFFVDADHKIRILQKNISDDYLSRFEENVLNEVSQRFYKYSYEDMKSYAHIEGVFPEWESVGKGEEKLIPMDAIMRAVHISEAEIPILLEEQEVFEQEAALFHSN